MGGMETRPNSANKIKVVVVRVQPSKSPDASDRRIFPETLALLGSWRRMIGCTPLVYVATLEVPEELPIFSKRMITSYLGYLGPVRL